MTAPNACVVGLTDPPGQSPDTIRAIANGWRSLLSGNGNLADAAQATNQLLGDTSDWQGAGATAFHNAVPAYVAAINRAADRVTTLASDVDRFANDLDDLQGHPGDGRSDTWWGLAEKLGKEGQAINALVADVQQRINTPVLTAPGTYIPPWPKGFSIPSDGASIAGGATANALDQWVCDPWMSWSGLSPRIQSALSSVQQLSSALAAYATRVQSFISSAPSYFSNVTADSAVTGSLAALPQDPSFLPQKGDPPIPMSEVASYTVTVQRGDNLSVIAQAAYGTQDWQRLYNTGNNRQVVGGNPNLIYAGETLTVTDPSGGTVPVTAAGIKTWAQPAAPAPQPAPQPAPAPSPQPGPVTPELNSAVNLILNGSNSCTAMSPQQYDAIKAYYANGPVSLPAPYSQQASQTALNWVYSHGPLLGPPEHYMQYPTAPPG